LCGRISRSGTIVERAAPTNKIVAVEVLASIVVVEVVVVASIKPLRPVRHEIIVIPMMIVAVVVMIVVVMVMIVKHHDRAERIKAEAAEITKRLPPIIR